jgi:hypothetical protein
MNASDSALTPRMRAEIALRGGYGERVPFTMYDNLLPRGRVERELRNRGLCIVCRRAVFKTHRPNVTVREEHFRESGRKLVRTRYETPVGAVETLREPAGFTSWYHEKMFRSPEDYKVLLFLIRDEVYEPDYEAFAREEAAFGEDAIFRANFGLEPLQRLISGHLMGMETFCIEWMERRDEILKLYDAMVEQRRKLYPVVAGSPVLHANYGGNVVPEIIGPETFREYYVPHYNEAAEIMHRHGKLIGCHFDANCKLLSEAIAGTDLDYVEAFTPAPDTDMTLAEARAAWPGKVLWLNFPSSLHLKTCPEIEKATVEMLSELESTDGVIMGVTEDIPPDAWQRSCSAIMDGLEHLSADRMSAGPGGR